MVAKENAQNRAILKIRIDSNAATTNEAEIWRHSRRVEQNTEPGVVVAHVSEFLLDAGVTAAEQTLADRRQFVLDETQWQAFQEALDRPVQNKTRLKSLLRNPGVLG